MVLHEIHGVNGRATDIAPFLELSGSRFSLAARYKVLAGGKHLNPNLSIDLSDDHASVENLPHIPSEGYQLIHTQWQERRRAVTTSVEKWGERAAKATAALFANQSGEEAQKALTQLFGGVGIAVDLSRPFDEQLSDVAAAFSGNFYTEFCQGEDSIQKLAGALVGAFAKEQDPEEKEQNPLGGLSLIGNVRDFRSSFAIAEPFFRKLLGDTALYQQFALCIDAQASHLSGELFEVVREIQDPRSPLSPEEHEILSILFRLSSRHQEYQMAEATDPALPAQRGDRPTIALADRSNPAWVVQDPEESDDSFGPPPRQEETSVWNEDEPSESFKEAFQHVVDIYPQLRLGLLVSLLRTHSDGEVEMPQVVKLAEVLSITPEVLQEFMQQHSKSILGEDDVDAINALFSSSPLFTQFDMPEAIGMIESQSFETVTEQVRTALHRLGISLHLAEDMDITNVFQYEACADLVGLILKRFQEVKHTGEINILQTQEVLADSMARMPTVYDQLSFIQTYTELEQLSALFEKTHQRVARPARRKKASPSDSQQRPKADAHTSGEHTGSSRRKRSPANPPAWMM